MTSEVLQTKNAEFIWISWAYLKNSDAQISIYSDAQEGAA